MSSFFIFIYLFANPQLLAEQVKLRDAENRDGGKSAWKEHTEEGGEGLFCKLSLNAVEQLETERIGQRLACSQPHLITSRESPGKPQVRELGVRGGAGLKRVSSRAGGVDLGF